MARKKILIWVVSFVLVVVAVIGVVALVGKRQDSKKGDNTTLSSTKVVTGICEPTEFKEACKRTLEDVAKNSSATPKDFIMAAIRATVDEVNKSRVLAQSLRKDLAKNSNDDDRFKGCEEYLDFSLDELDEALQIVTDSQANTLGERVHELLKWLTAARVDLTTCLDEIDNPEHKAAMENALLNTTQFTYNAQDIVSGFANILQALGVSAKSVKLPPRNSRRLLEEAAEVKREGYPSWLPAAERKLLATAEKNPPPNPNATVAKDGTGDFKTIGAALDAYPEGSKRRYNIYVKAGIYAENVIVRKEQQNILMYGDGPERTIVTANLNVKLMNLRTSDTATFTVLGKGFVGMSMSFRNTAGSEGEQAVALRVHADNVAIYNCSIEGYQDTLYYHNLGQFYKNCTISGTVDFIFGTGPAVIQDSIIIVRKPGEGQSNMVTADGRERDVENGGVVLQNCRIIADADLVGERLNFPTYLGRPWKPAARTIIMESELDDLIRPEGFAKWSNDPKENHHETCFYREHANHGPGAETSRRVNWPKSYRVINDTKEAARYTAGRFIQGDSWLKNTAVPFYSGLSK